jgi:hypothetical protein
MSASRKTPKETTMNIRILTIAAATAIAVTAFGFNAPASAAPLGLASQTMAQSIDSPVLEISKKGGKKGKWGGHKGKWGGHKGKWGGHTKFYYGGYAPYYHGGCYKQVQLLVGGYYAWHTINICN